ncbi:hypothetical protein K6W36_18430 [Acetobacter senegalensis]|uniref:hypothetical protein n=1 Tax=Acetobacter senegalensis TaxID=446692 RepID=UPI001EDB8E99|nr:hypothetical protein [Acetobacter senegalensis]MCG4262507.1 hypothetical protein [Acetobacter senegalensis]
MATRATQVSATKGTASSCPLSTPPHGPFRDCASSDMPGFPVAIGLRTIGAPVRMPQQADRIRFSTPVTGFATHRSPPLDDVERQAGA